ncbi:MAG: tRNA (adenosine(37)-N6)-threonylcarbamoyltransferase complex dimerization subunit type 1 TsaB [Phyllobacteriaceae bacterium]|nr:tRNA (adenosine(37)-N6)-threonylcarbamoyltransferase complex dimerization subunit type 1 TsaB [Phyllobacteriaceae bacterium]
MIVLALDTASTQCAACVYDAEADREMSRIVRPMATGHAAALSDVIDEALESAGKSYRDIGRVASTVGPGSFTGVRIGVAAARGLALALAIPSVGVDVLDALAEPVRKACPGRAVMAALDARRDEVYAALWNAEGNQVLASVALTIARAREIAAGANAILTGSAAPMIRGDDLAVEGVSASPDIGMVARLAASADATKPASPLYLRKPDAKPQSGQSLPRRTP